MELLRQLGTLYAESAAAIAAAWPWFWPLVGAGVGAVFGSFLTCMGYRLPRRIPLRRPPSHCPACRTVLGVPDLVPVLSFVALRGRCRHCGAPIGPASLVVEVLCALAGAALAVWIQA